MARTEADVNTVTRNGIVPATLSACDVVNGDVAVGLHKGMWIEVTNTDGANARTITFVTPGSARGFAIEDHVVSIPASGVRKFGNFPTDTFGSNLEFDGETVDVEFAVYQIA